MKEDKDINKLAQVYLNNVLFHVPGSIYWKSREGVYLGCNEFQAKMAGFNSCMEVIGKTDYDLPWKNIADILTETDQRIMQTGQS